jgi:hypothetical protein
VPTTDKETDAMGSYARLFRALAVASLVAVSHAATDAADPALGVVFQRPTSGATVSGPAVAIVFAGFGGSDPDGSGRVERRFVLAIAGEVVVDDTLTVPYHRQEAGFLWDIAGEPDGPYLVEVTVFDEAGNSASNAITVNVSNAQTPPGQTPPGTEPVVWTSPVNVTVAGNAITKNAGCNGCSDAGAVSQQSIQSGDGAVEFTVSAKAALTVGLSTGNPGMTLNEIDFGLRFAPGNVVQVRESGRRKAVWRFPAGATHKIAIESGAVKYYLDGAVKYTSRSPVTYPLLVDTVLWTVGGAVKDAVMTTVPSGDSTSSPSDAAALPAPGQEPSPSRGPARGTPTARTAP